jgi:hypothetical protein
VSESLRARRLWSAGVLCGLLLIYACGNDGTSGESCMFAESSCDIAKASCQRAILALTACVRGERTPALPKLRTITPDKFRAELMAEVAHTDASMTTPWDPALAALHLLPSDVGVAQAAIDTEVQLTAAYYDDQTKQVSIIEPQAGGDAVDAMYVLSHEFTHYLQDRDTNLGELRKRYVHDTDSGAAFRSLIEGEAMVNSTRALARMLGRKPTDLDWTQFFNMVQSDTLQQVQGSDAPLLAADIGLPYSVGGIYIADVWNGYGRVQVDRLFADPPVSMVDWIAGYGVGKRNPSLVEPLDCAPPAAPKGYEVYGLDSLGAVGALALLSAVDPQAFRQVRSLRGDSIAVYSPRDGAAAGAATLVAWRLRFSDTRALEAFQASIENNGFTLRAFDRELLIAASSQPSDNSWTDAALDACPKLEELMPIESPSAAMAARFRIR